MPEGLIGGRRHQRDAFPYELFGAATDVGKGDLEGQLQRGTAGGSSSVRGGPARPRQSQRVGADAILDPARRQLPDQGNAEHVLVKAAHRRHVAHKMTV
jgi:hypothetical protein